MKKKSNLITVKICSILFVFLIITGCKKNDTGEHYIEPLKNTFDGPIAGNPNGNYPLPEGSGLEDISNPDYVIGDGTPESITAQAFIDAVYEGGVITFNSGGEPVTIELPEPAKVYNRDGLETVIDGGGLITLSGRGRNRILFMNTCYQELNWLTSRCDNQEYPKLTVQNLIFANGNAISRGEGVRGEDAEELVGGGGAIWIRGGRFKAVNCRFYNNACGLQGPDVGGGAIRVFNQYNNLPVFITHCTFGGGEEYANYGSNGGALSSIGVSWTIINSLFSHNYCTGDGGNPAQDGLPGGGSGGAIYNDGNTMTLKILGTLIEENTVNRHGSAIFFVTNDHTGNIVIDQSTIRNNHGGWWYAHPGISMHDDTRIEIVNSTLQE